MSCNAMMVKKMTGAIKLQQRNGKVTRLKERFRKIPQNETALYMMAVLRYITQLMSSVYERVNQMATQQKAIKKIGHYRLYKVEGWGHYEIYSGTKTNGVHVENIAHPENFEWAVAEIKAECKREIEAEFGIDIK